MTLPLWKLYSIILDPFIVHFIFNFKEFCALPLIENNTITFAICCKEFSYYFDKFVFNFFNLANNSLYSSSNATTSSFFEGMDNLPITSER